MAAPHRMNFRKNSKQPSIPLSFSENVVANLLQWIWSNICKEVRGPDSMKCMHMISRDRDHSEGWRWGSTAVWNLSENSSDLVVLPVPNKSFTKRHFINLFGFHTRFKCSN